MPDNTYYGPLDETPNDIFLEKTFMAAGYLTALAYGIQLVLYCACVQILWKRDPRTRFIWFLIIFITILCAMNTIWTGTSAYGLQLTFIDNRNYPGGPIGFLQIEFSLPVNVLSNASFIIGNILADGLLLWRCRVIYSGSLPINVNYIMVLPTLMLLGSLAMAIIYAVETANPTIGLFSRVTASFAVPYFALSMSLNILLTFMIWIRMLLHVRQSRAILGRRWGRHYTSIYSMFIESAALYSINALILLVTFEIGHPINQIFLALAPGVQMISNYLIIYRVAQGRAWNSDTFTVSGPALSSIAFHSTFGSRTNAEESHPKPNAIDIPLHSMNDGNKMKALSTDHTASDAASSLTFAKRKGEV